MVDVSDPYVRREIHARLEREQELNAPAVCRTELQPPGWLWHVIAHLFWLFVQASS